MNTPRPFAVALACVCIGASACTATSSSAAELSVPPSTIGLGFEFETEPGSLLGVADVEVQADDAEEIDTIVMVGDSITVGSTPALEQRFEALGFENVLIEAETGKRMTMTDGGNASGLAVVEYLANSDPTGDRDHELWIIALGTNDINQYGSVEQIADEVDEVLAAVPDEAALVWVDTYSRDERDGAGRVNLVITERVDDRGNAVVAPWSAFGADAVSSDGYHPSPGGREVFADVVAATVAGFLED